MGKSMTTSKEINFAYKSAVQYVLHDGYTFCRDCFRVKANHTLHVRVDIAKPFDMFPTKSESIDVDLHPCQCSWKGAKLEKSNG